MVMNYLSHNCYIKTLLSLKNDLNYDSSVDSLLKTENLTQKQAQAQMDSSPNSEAELDFQAPFEDQMEEETIQRRTSHGSGNLHNAFLRKLSTASGFKEVSLV
jgi:hypothetical protein